MECTTLSTQLSTIKAQSARQGKTLDGVGGSKKKLHPESKICSGDNGVKLSTKRGAVALA